MGEPFLGEIRDFGFAKVPKNWMNCDGSILSVNENQALFSLIGDTYGGNGRTTFAIPDLRGRAPLGQGTLRNNNFYLGRKIGAETTTLGVDNLPSHTHELFATTKDADTDEPSLGALGNTRSNVYASSTQSTPNLDTQLRAGTIGDTGSSAPIENLQPYLVTNYCIAIEGLYPSRP